MARSNSASRAPAGFALVWMATALDLIGFGIVIPLLPKYAEEFGAGPWAAAAVVATFSAAQFAFAPLWGRLSDRVGRRPALIAALIGSSIGSLVTGLAGALWVLYLGRVIDGASGSAYAIAQASVSDVAEPAERPRLLGLLASAFGIGFIVGPLIGSFAALGSPELPFFIAAGLSAVNALLMARSFPETLPPDHRVEPTRGLAARLDTIRQAGLRPIFAVVAITTVAFSGFEATFALFIDERFGLEDSSIYGIFASIGIALVIVQVVLVGRVNQRYEATSVVAGALAFLGLGLAAMGIDAGWVLFAASLLFVVVGQGLLTPTIASVVVDRAGSARGELLGIQQGIGGLSRVIGPILAGALFEFGGAGWPYWVGGALVGVALVAWLRSVPRPAAGRVTPESTHR